MTKTVNRGRRVTRNVPPRASTRSAMECSPIPVRGNPAPVARRAVAPGPRSLRLKDLVDAGLEGPVRGPLKDVLADKAVSGERDGHPRVPELDAWLQTTLAELTDVVADLATAPKVPWERLNEVFLAVVRSAQAG